ncbi:hypothetical protein N3K66_003580 [Trichothecium roseum]|uniref:Uncharacterized protein n=1 Tax=Trichothecium roseum TaxID=47278 RepID=A0ACC0V5W6_9HYPO|nr:hypothetical protein N3K66_003580 [Trichothecium roseum]
MSATTTTTTATATKAAAAPAPAEAPDRVPRGDVTASLNFYSPPPTGEAPFNYTDVPPPGEPQRNFSDVVVPVLIRDARSGSGRGNDPTTAFTLDRDAFAILRGLPPSAEKAFADDASIERNYYPEVTDLLLANVPGASKVHIFDHTVRRPGPDAARGPVQRAHVDQTAASVEKRVRRYFDGEEADALLSRRYRLINVWRPLNTGPVESMPLAFASSASVRDGDVVPVEHRYPDGYVGQTAAIRYDEKQEWYYLSGMTGDERILLECFDSESLKAGSGVAGGRVPHSAFAHPRTRDDAVGRESIEIRALVFGP